MGNISITDTELLKYAIENGMIDAALVQEKIEMQRRKDLLEKHPYKIYEGKDKKWYTYLPDDEKGRVFKKRNTKAELEDLVIDYWEEKAFNPTINEIFKEWLSAKTEREEITKSTRDRYIRQYEQCFEKFGKRKVREITEYDIENFILDSVHKHELTAKGFSNLRTLVFGIFKLAKKKRLISYSITETVADIDISQKAFRKKTDSNDKQVFTEDELPAVIKYLEENQDMINLGILLLFKTGLRIGELAGLKKCDICGNIIHVNRTEVCYEGDNKERIFMVRDFPKTEAGIRDVIIPDSALWILRKLRNMSPFGEYLFECSGERIRTYVFRNRLRTVCRATGVVEKSPHKIRKTYGSILIDSGANESLILEQMGHTDIRTTKEHYYRNRQNCMQKAEVINNIVGL